MKNQNNKSTENEQTEELNKNSQNSSSVINAFTSDVFDSADDFIDSPFATGLTSTSAQIRKARASVLSKRVSEAQIDLIRSIRAQIASLRDRLSNILDLRAQTTMDLRIKNIDPVKFVSEIQEIEEELYALNIKLTVSINTYKKLFGKTPQF